VNKSADIIIIGAGAAGLMAAIWAARTRPDRRIVVLDGARTLGAKILVAGGGRCNVTHYQVDEIAYAGSSRNAIKKVLRGFDVARTVEFFRELDVELKKEDTGKLFPVSDSARTVLDALLNEAGARGVRIVHPFRVHDLQHDAEGFRVIGDAGEWTSEKVILATGGRSLPKSGSDGAGYKFATAMGHRLTDRMFPALVPLTLARDHFICELSGLTLETTLQVRSGSGAKLASFTNSTLCTHFGLSGPSVLDISRYYLDAKATDPGTTLVINWSPGQTFESLEARMLREPHAPVGRVLRTLVPERLAVALALHSGVELSTSCLQIPRENRRVLVRNITEMSLPITGDRGYTYAEVTAGGVPLDEIHLATMASRVCLGLHLCGEICDVDGRIGGFNFQWAWSSGYAAGVSV